jgi:hypothetical protein
VYLPFDGAQTTSHEGFDRCDFIMDDATGPITPMTAQASKVTTFGIDVSMEGGKRRFVVVVRRTTAPGLRGHADAAMVTTSLQPKSSC